MMKNKERLKNRESEKKLRENESLVGKREIFELRLPVKFDRERLQSGETAGNRIPEMV